MDRSDLIFLVSQRLRVISAHDLQLLAEDIAKIKFPDRFQENQLIRPGRNEQAQTTKGWPDAYVAVGLDGADAIEATRDRSNWEKHLDEDFQKAQGRAGRRLVGYVFIGGYPDKDPAPSTIEAWVRKFISLGIPKEKICILIGKELAFELADPQFARIRQDILGIASSPISFLLLAPGLLGEDRLGAFQPSQEDFQQNRVWRPPLADTVVMELLAKQCALVRGHGAVGKTTLAQLLSADHRIAPYPVYYLDLNRLLLRGDNGGAAKNDLVQFGGSNVLFIVDNVHLDELLALDLAQHWLRFVKSLGSRLLLLGREIAKQSGSPVAGIEPFVLRADRDAMRGVLARLFAREKRSVPQFSNEQVDEWVQTFGGDPTGPNLTVDLIAFSAAVERRFDSLMRGDHRLSPSDAVDVIRTHYLQRVASMEEKKNLFRLSSLAPLELALPAESLPHPAVAFEVANRILGLVLSERVGRDGRIYYQLAHPALGQLIVAAFGHGHDPAAERSLAATQDVSLGLRIHDRLRLTQEQQQIATVLAHQFANSDWPTGVGSLNALMNSMRRATRQKFVTVESVDSLVSEGTSLSRLYLEERWLSAMIDFNSRAQAFPRTLAAVAALTDTSSGISTLCEALYVSHVVDVTSFLRSYPSRTQLLAAMSCERWNKAQGQIGASAHDPAQTVMALRYFEQHGRPELVEVPSRRLLEQSIVPTHQNQWARANLDHVSHLLRMCAAASIATREAFVREISTQNWIASRFEQNRLGVLTGALFSLSNYVEPELRHYFANPALGKRLRDELHDTWMASEYRTMRAICLLGAFEAFARRELTGLEKVVWPPADKISELVKLYARDSETDVVGTHELELWLGLRAMMRWRKDSVTIKEGERFLRRLQNSVSPTPLGRRSLNDLQAWLGECQLAKWELVH